MSGEHRSDSHSPRNLLGEHTVYALTIALRGCGNLCFQSNAITGFFFLIAVAINSRIQLAGMITGAVLGPITGVLLKENRSPIEAGRYGFSPCLVGLALTFFLEPGIGMFGLVILGCLSAAVLTRIGLYLAPFPIFASPYIITVWVLLWVAHQTNLPMAEHLKMDSREFNIGFAIIEGMGSALFSSNLISGLFYLVGLGISNPKHALVAIIGSILGSLLALWNHDPAGLIQMGYYGFNGVLCSVATYVFCGPSLRLPMFGAIVATILIDFFTFISLPPLGAPFVITTWGILLLGGLEKKLGMVKTISTPPGIQEKETGSQVSA